jgi:hypothetical protein
MGMGINKSRRDDEIIPIYLSLRASSYIPQLDDLTAFHGQRAVICGGTGSVTYRRASN